MIVPFTEIVKNCTIAMIRILLYCFGGFLLARKGILNDEQIRGLSKISQDLLIPTLTFSNFVSMDREYIITYYPVILSSIIIIFLGMYVGKLVCKYVVRQDQYSMMFQVVCGFTHTLNIQLSMAEALSPLLNRIDDMANRKYSMDAQARGPIFVMIYTIVNTIVRWSLLTNLIKKQDQSYELKISTPKSKLDLESSDAETQDTAENSGDLGQKKVPSGNERTWSSKILEFFNVPLASALISVFIAVIPPLQDVFVNEKGFVKETITESVDLLSDASSPVLLVLLGANFGNSEPGEEKVSLKVIGGASLAKMIIMPSLGIVIIFTFKILGIMNDPAMMVVILTSFAAPTANNILVQYANQGKDMVTVSKMVLGTYICSVLTVPLTLVAFFSFFPFN